MRIITEKIRLEYELILLKYLKNINNSENYSFDQLFLFFEKYLHFIDDKVLNDLIDNARRVLTSSSRKTFGPNIYAKILHELSCNDVEKKIQSLEYLIFCSHIWPNNIPPELIASIMSIISTDDLNQDLETAALQAIKEIMKIRNDLVTQNDLKKIFEISYFKFELPKKQIGQFLVDISEISLSYKLMIVDIIFEGLIYSKQKWIQVTHLQYLVLFSKYYPELIADLIYIHKKEIIPKDKAAYLFDFDITSLELAEILTVQNSEFSAYIFEYLIENLFSINSADDVYDKLLIIKSMILHNNVNLSHENLCRIIECFNTDNQFIVSEAFDVVIKIVEKSPHLLPEIIQEIDQRSDLEDDEKLFDFYVCYENYRIKEIRSIDDFKKFLKQIENHKFLEQKSDNGKNILEIIFDSENEYQINYQKKQKADIILKTIQDLACNDSNFLTDFIQSFTINRPEFSNFIENQILDKNINQFIPIIEQERFTGEIEMRQMRMSILSNEIFHKSTKSDNNTIDLSSAPDVNNYNVFNFFSNAFTQVFNLFNFQSDNENQLIISRNDNLIVPSEKINTNIPKLDDYYGSL